MLLLHCPSRGCAGRALTYFLSKAVACLWESSWHGQDLYLCFCEALNIMAGMQIIKAHLTKQYKNHKFQQPFHHAL